MSTASSSSPFALPIAALLVAIAGAVAIGVSMHRVAAAGAAEQAREQRALADARSRFQRAGDERDLLARYAPRYRALQVEGFVGPGQRVNWVDALRAAAEEARLPGVQYQIAAETALPLPPPGATGLLHSPMTLEVQLLHEADLLRFLRALQARRAGVSLLEACTLERLGSAAEPPRADVNLRAECRLSWITAPAPATSAQAAPLPAGTTARRP